MANFARSGVLAIIAITFLSLMVFRNMGWISWANDTDPLTNSMKQSSSADNIKHSKDNTKHSADDKKQTLVDKKHSPNVDVKMKNQSHDIRKFLKPPNPYLSVNKADTKYSQAHQDVTVYNILPIDGGFFVEIGAFNGVQFSNTLWLERKHNWTGLLIEANPDLCSQVDRVKRMAWRLCACISKELDTIFMKGGALGGVGDTMNKVVASSLKGRGRIKVPCFTLSEALGVIGVKQIDYFSLDVEGAELFILESMMEDLQTRHITVKVWTIEYRIYDGRKVIKSESVTKLNKIRSFFTRIGGYTEHLQLDNSPTRKSDNKTDGDFLDVVFVQNELYHEYCKRNLSVRDENKCKMYMEHSEVDRKPSADNIKLSNANITRSADDAKHSPNVDVKNQNQNHDIRKFLKPPNPYLSVNNADTKYSQAHQDVTVYNILPIDGGFFVEIGAFNGVLFSNTLWFERKHNWTGLLIEANPDFCSQVDRVKRMAWRLCACISKELDTIFIKGGALGGVGDTMNKVVASSLKGRGRIKVPCFTLSEALGVIGVTQIDYFSLDVEGAELFILESMMEDLQTRHITVKVWTIEYRIYDGRKMIKSESVTKLNKIRSFFTKIGGYTEHLQLDIGPTKKGYIKTDGDFLDVVFVQNELYQEYCKRNPSVLDGNKCKN